jgi:negative regulator of sigma E activity
MLLEHRISPLYEAQAHQLWEELTADLILAGKIPPLENWGDSSGTQERIEAKLRDVSETHRLRNERLQASQHVSQETPARSNSQTSPLCEYLDL